MPNPDDLVFLSTFLAIAIVFALCVRAYIIWTMHRPPKVRYTLILRCTDGGNEFHSYSDPQTAIEYAQRQIEQTPDYIDSYEVRPYYPDFR